LAENQEDRNSDDLSDEPSAHKIEQMRKKGQVAQSRELTSIIALLISGTALFYLTPGMGTALTEYMQYLFRVDVISKLNFAQSDILSDVFWGLLMTIVKVGLPVMLISFVLSGLVAYFQVGSIWSTDPLKPDPNRINPIKGIKKYLSLRQVYDSFRLVFKGFTLVVLAYWVVKDRVIQSPSFLLQEAEGLLAGYEDSAQAVFIALSIALIFFAVFDLWLQRWEYNRQARVTKKEAKEEHKEREGDPMIRARIRSVQREMARKRMMADVQTADVVVTNPTHIAIALKYDRDAMDAPRVVAKGTDFVAQRIKKIAADSGVTIVENVPLARTLNRVAEVGEAIPKSLYQAVAEVLAYVYRLQHQVF